MTVAWRFFAVFHAAVLSVFAFCVSWLSQGNKKFHLRFQGAQPKGAVSEDSSSENEEPGFEAKLFDFTHAVDSELLRRRQFPMMTWLGLFVTKHGEILAL